MEQAKEAYRQAKEVWNAEWVRSLRMMPTRNDALGPAGDALDAAAKAVRALGGEPFPPGT